jgi:hypothetical protein
MNREMANGEALVDTLAQVADEMARLAGVREAALRRLTRAALTLPRDHPAFQAAIAAADDACSPVLPDLPGRDGDALGRQVPFSGLRTLTRKEVCMADQQTRPAEFSPASARLAADELFQALPKTKRVEYLGHLNEILVVIEGLARKAGQDEDATVQ